MRLAVKQVKNLPYALLSEHSNFRHILEIIVSLKVLFFWPCASCVIIIRKYCPYLPCCKTGCMGFPQLCEFFISPQHAFASRFKDFFPACIFATSVAFSPVKSIYGQIIIFTCNFYWVSSHPASVTLSQFYLTSSCENFKLLSFIAHTLATGIRHLRLEQWLPNIFPIICSKNYWDPFPSAFLALS